jgi:solute carrier family 45, member 1/2/4
MASLTVLDFTPYLLELGLAKSQTALVWLAPPLSGMIMQPLIGTISDSSTLRWGRRRPYMLVASWIVAISLLTLGWASEVCRTFIADDALVRATVVA